MSRPRWNSTAERTKLYPPNWREVSAAIKARSGGRCECEGAVAVVAFCVALLAVIILWVRRRK